MCLDFDLLLFHFDGTEISNVLFIVASAFAWLVVVVCKFVDTNPVLLMYGVHQDS